MARETTGSLKKWKQKEAKLLARRALNPPHHTCWDHVEYVETDGALGQAWYCRVCGDLLQVG
jgi:hypothetical protein